MPDISKIQLPGSNQIYDIKDAWAREQIAHGVHFYLSWDGLGVPYVSQIPEGVKVKYNGTTYTGTLSAQDADTNMIYLVYSGSQVGEDDTYDEYIVVDNTEIYTQTPKWEKLGDTRVDMTNVVTDVTLNKQTDVVLGEATTFTNSTSSVSFGTHTTKSAIGANATFSVTQPTISVTPATTNIKATASGTAVSVSQTATVATAAASVTNVVNQITDESSIPVTEITEITNTSTEEVSKVTKETANKLVVTSIPNVTGNTSVSIPNVTGNTSVTIPNVTSVGSASTWSFTVGGTGGETLIVSGANSTAPTLGTALSASKVTLGTALSASKVTLGTAITAATGALSTSGQGGDPLSGLKIENENVLKTISTRDLAVSFGSVLGVGGTATVAKAVSVSQQPTIALSTGASAGTGVISVATGISSASASGGAVAFNSKDSVSAITALGAGTAAAQTITVGTSDKVTALTNATSITVTKGSN